MNQNHEEALFEAALEKTVEKRAAFLDAVCGDAAALRQCLDALLAAHKQPATELKESDIEPDRAPAESSVTLLDESALTEESGTQIGRYKLLEKLGEGGFGSVWAAEQKEPVRGRVALKIIKLGMDTKQVVARFESIY